MVTDWISALPADIFSIFLLSGDSSVVIETLPSPQLPAKDMFCLAWSFKNSNRTAPERDTTGGSAAVGEDEERRSEISVESLPRLDSYQRILSWLSNCEYQQQNISYPTEEEEEEEEQEANIEEAPAAARKELKDASKSRHPKKFIRPYNMFRNRNNNSDRTFQPRLLCDF